MVIKQDFAHDDAVMLRNTSTYFTTSKHPKSEKNVISIDAKKNDGIENQQEKF